MGSNQFQREYIEYLQERNSELLNKISHMKENYENKIFSKDLSKHYLLTALENVLDVCTALPQEIDLFFEKMTEVMEMLAKILLRKSEMVQLVEKISEAINPNKNFNADILRGVDETAGKEQNLELRDGKKGTVKVSPMINGHVISTDPKIYLSRISKEITPRRINDLHQLSPIIEASPDTDFSDFEKSTYKEIRIPLERLNIEKLSKLNVESPKSRFKGRKTWKNSLSLKKQHSDILKIDVSKGDEENLSNNTDVHKSSLKSATDNEGDPLEGPSWLYEEENHFGSSFLHSKSIDYRRRKHRFASVFDRNEDFLCADTLEKNGKADNESEVLFRNNFGRSSEDIEFIDTSKEIKESSKDIISESQIEEKVDKSFLEEVVFESERKYVIESSDENDFSENETKNNASLSTPQQKIHSCDTNFHKFDTNYEADCEDCSIERKSINKSYRKRRSKTVSNEIPVEVSLKREETPKFNSISGFVDEKHQNFAVEQGRSKSKSGERNSKKKNKKFQKDLIIKLEDCMLKNTYPRQSKEMSLKEKSCEKINSVTSESSTSVISVASEGRKKRKAAPTNLCEPSLMTKLRRG